MRFRSAATGFSGTKEEHTTMKHKRIIAMIGSLSLVLGCFFNEATCEETAVYAAEALQEEGVTDDGQEVIVLNTETEPADPDQENTGSQSEERVQEAEADLQPSTSEPEDGSGQWVEAVSAPGTEAAPASEPEKVTVPEIETVSDTETESALDTEDETVIDPEPESGSNAETERKTEALTNEGTQAETGPAPCETTVDMSDEGNQNIEDGSLEEPETGIETSSMEVPEANIETGRMEETDAVAEVIAEVDTKPDTDIEATSETMLKPAIGEIIKDVRSAIGPETECSGDVIQKGAIEDISYSPVSSTQRDFRFTRIDKHFAIVSPLSDCLIREKMDLSSKAVGKVKREGIVFILEKAGDWCFVESGQVRGFMKEETLYTGEAVNDQARRIGEPAFDEAVQLCAPGDNEAFTFTLTTVQEVVAEKREGIVTDSTNILEYASPSSKVIGEAKSGTLVYLLATAADGWYFVESGNVRGFVPFDCILSGKAAASIIADEGDKRTALAEEVTAPEENRSLYFTVQSVREAQETLPVFKSKDYLEAGSDATSYSVEQLQLIWAIVAQEDNGSYEGALAVISSAMNRAESARWGYLGGNALSQLTAPGQYCYSLDHYWQARLGGNVPEYVKQAVYDCLVHGIRNHSYTSFRSTRGKTTGADSVQIGGNWFFGS